MTIYILACPSGCEECHLGDDGVTVTCDECFDSYIKTSANLCVGEF